MRVMKLALLLLLCAVSMWGQADANKAQLIGTVKDPNGAVVPNAKVKITNAGTGLVREMTTGGDGEFRAVQLDPGRYEVVANASGFAATTLTGVVLTVGSSVALDVNMQIQATSTSVDVAETLINVVTPAPSTVIGSQAIADLPINGRRFQDFATLTPTVNVDPSRGQLSFAGQRGINGNVMVDGADYNQPFFGGIRGGERSNTNFTIPQGAVQEFQVVSTGYAAEYGRSTGGVLNVITKSGTNEFHGGGFYQTRNRELSAENPIFKVKPAETLHQLGGNIGGPIRANKLFFFSATEFQKADTPGAVLFNALDAITPTAATREAYDFFRSLQEPFKRENRAVATTGKLDYQMNAGHRLSTRYNFSDSEEPNSVSTGGSLNPFTNGALSNEGTEKNRLHFGTAQYTHLFSPAVVTDFKFSGSYEVRPRLSNSQAVSVDARNIGFYGARNFLPTTQDDYRWQFTSGTSIVSGKNTFKFGIDYSKLSTVQSFGFGQFGEIAFQNTADINNLLEIMSVGGTIANRFDSPQVIYRRQVGNLIADLGATQMALYAQDSIRVSPKLTLDFGLRWEGQWNPEVDASNTTLVNRVNILYPTGGRLDVTKIPDSLKQIMPRFGFAWSPFDSSRRFVIRGNAGVFYAATPLLVFSAPTNNFRNPPGDVRLQIGPFAAGSTNTIYNLFRGIGIDLNTVSLGNLPILTVEQAQRMSQAASGGTAVDPLVGGNLTPVAPDFQNPRSYQSGIGFETEITSNWVAGAQYQQVNAVHLQRNRDYNLPLPVVRAADGRPIYTRANRPVPLQGTYSVRESSARSRYQATVFSTQYRSRRMTFGAFYTLSRLLSDDDNERDSGGVQAQDSFNFAPDYHYSNLDARHQFVANALFNLPWGVELSGIFRSSTGRPINPAAGTDANGDAANTDRPYQAVGVPFKRNSFRNRSVVTNNDVRIMKSFNLGSERFRIQLSAEFFNVLNLENVIWSGQANVYGLGIGTNGQPVPIDSRFMRLYRADGSFDPATTSQAGNPFQSQFGVRFFF